MSSFRYCASDVSLQAAAHCRVSSLAMASRLKKSLRAEERKRADVARARRRWIREQGWLDTTRLVFIDETAITTNMVRLNGWGPRGERLVADAPMEHWETVTFIAGLRQTGIVAPMLIKGAMNGEDSWLTSSNVWRRRSSMETLWWLTMCPSTRSLGSRRLSGVLAQASDSCRSILPILTPSSWRSIPSRLACARLPSAQSKDCTDVSDHSFGRSIPLNAGGILGMQAMTHYDWDVLGGNRQPDLFVRTTNILDPNRIPARIQTEVVPLLKLLMALYIAADMAQRREAADE